MDRKQLKNGRVAGRKIFWENCHGGFFRREEDDKIFFCYMLRDQRFPHVVFTDGSVARHPDFTIVIGSGEIVEGLSIEDLGFSKTSWAT